MNNNEDLLKNYIESQKRGKEILEETKKRRLRNKNNAEQTKKISQNTKYEIKTAPEFLMLAETEYENRNFKVAITFLNNAIEIDPKVANYYLRRGLAKVNLIDQQETYDFLKDDPELSKSFNIANYLDVISDKKLDYQSAIDDYTKAIEIDPSDADYYFFRGIGKEKLKDYQGAIDDYTKAIEINPNYASFYAFRADAKFKLKDYRGAIDDYTKAIEINPNYDRYNIMRANAKRKLEDNEGADENNKKAEKPKNIL